METKEAEKILSETWVPKKTAALEAANRQLAVRQTCIIGVAGVYAGTMSAIQSVMAGAIVSTIFACVLGYFGMRAHNEVKRLNNSYNLNLLKKTPAVVD